MSGLGRDTLRQQLADTLRREVWAVKVAGLSEAEGEHLADAVLRVFDAWQQQQRDTITAILGPDDRCGGLRSDQVIHEVLAVLEQPASEDAT